jgi:threonine dehydratase
MPETLPIIPGMSDILDAAASLAPHISRTPLLPLNIPGDTREIYLKLENLQPIGVYKVRSIGNVMLTAGENALRQGVYTASSGNAGLGVAWMAARLGVNATIYAPQSAPDGKLAACREFGADVQLMSDEEWWRIITRGGHPTDPGMYVDAVRDPAALAGNGTIGLEIIEQLPDVDRIIVPFGGGGVVSGIAAAIRAGKSDTRITVAESDAAMPLTNAFSQGEPVEIQMASSFISGAGAPCVLEEMWPLVSQLVDDTAVVPVSGVAHAVRVLFENNRVVAEGAGAIPVAAALADETGRGKTVCVVTGGNIDRDVMVKILQQQL